MTKLEIKYYKFWYRLLISSRFVYPLISLIILRFWIYLSSSITFFSFTLFDLIVIPILIILFIISFHRAVYYLSLVELDDHALTVRIHQYDRISKEQIIEYHNLDIELYLNLLSKYNSYRLVISKRNVNEKFTFEIVHKQFEIGFWNRSNLKELFSVIRNKQGKLSNTDHIK